MTSKLNASSIAPGLKVHVVPNSGSVAVLASCVAAGTLLDVADWQNPVPGVSLPRDKRNLVAVQVDEVFAAGLIVPRYKKDGELVTLGTLQELCDGNSVSVLLPLTMVAPFIAARRVYERRPDQRSPRQQARARETPTPETEDEWMASEAVQLDDNGIVDVETITREFDAEPHAYCHELGAIPEEFTEQFSSVLGDAFHYMDR